MTLKRDLKAAKSSIYKARVQMNEVILDLMDRRVPVRWYYGRWQQVGYVRSSMAGETVKVQNAKSGKCRRISVFNLEVVE